MSNDSEHTKISVGSTNPIKITALTEIIQDYPHLKNAVVVGHENKFTSCGPTKKSGRNYYWCHEPRALGLHRLSI